MKIYLFAGMLAATFISSCATPVTPKHWAACEIICRKHGGISDARVGMFSGPGCNCKDDEVIWIDDVSKKKKKKKSKVTESNKENETEKPAEKKEKEVVKEKKKIAKKK